MKAQMKTDMKLQRRKIYQKTLKYYKTFLNCPIIFRYNGFCNSIPKVVNISRINILQRLPELLAQKPKKNYYLKELEHSRFWWHPQNIKRRIKALEDAIKLTY